MAADLSYGQLIAFFICEGAVSLFTLYRLVLFAKVYAMGEDWDSLDDSVIPDSGITAGTHPGGILVDWFIFLVCSVVIGLLYWILIPGGIIWAILYMFRKYNIERIGIINKLKGNK